MRHQDRAQVTTWKNGQPERLDIIGFEGSFHGRTLGADQRLRQSELP